MEKLDNFYICFVVHMIQYNRMSYTSVDFDNNLHYEVNSLGRKILNLALIPVLNNIPASVRPLLRKTHDSANDIIQHATTHRALEILYGHSSAKTGGNILKKTFKAIWLSTNNSKAVRNRLKLVKRELENKISSLTKANHAIKIVSIASGSSRAIIESIDRIHFEVDPNLSVIFVDKNHDAIVYSKELAKDHKYLAKFEWVHDTAGNFFRVHAAGRKFNIIEMVGLMDYFDDEKAINIFTQIFNSLEDDGILITANIGDNPERPFVTKAVGWEMVYRSADQFVVLLKKAGFSEDKIKAAYEPQRIHVVVIATK